MVTMMHTEVHNLSNHHMDSTIKMEITPSILKRTTMHTTISHISLRLRMSQAITP